MNTQIPESYVGNNFYHNLTSTRTRLLFVARISHGVGFDECVEYRVGPSKCGRFDVLWIRNESDWGDEGSQTVAAGWLPRGVLKGAKLHAALLEKVIFDEMSVHRSDRPNFSEVATSNKPLFSSKQVWEIVDLALEKSGNKLPDNPYN